MVWPRRRPGQRCPAPGATVVARRVCKEGLLDGGAPAERGASVCGRPCRGGQYTDWEVVNPRDPTCHRMADFDVRGEQQGADVGQLLVDHSGGVEPSVVLVGGIRMSTTSSSLFSHASETRSVPLRPATLVRGFPAGRYAGSEAGGKPAMGVGGDDIWSQERKSVNHGPRQRRVRLAGLARRRVATSRRRPSKRCKSADVTTREA
jgi:hypothetical protein